ncbi:ECF RNA polymerase sigma-E factor [Enhygromyxa salina]|uniref:ECF RNA polymerase sigma-E factor n=1 Tax=Enhygromyxa salina TaxID=215803 RepID=A0A2S9YK00_9BACT|nr:sigma-70 family RNA polymerase sigma factor [Enhygromyxa salina]PRQ05427.1 ECF RNA polymerase sigma-E factor [Enhygromyxa salina]
MPGDWELDAALLEAWRKGDGQAGERLFDRHADAVARFFENKVRVGAEDLTQTTFERLIKGRDRVREGVAFRAFVLGIARNVMREHLRELARGREVDPEVEAMADLAPGPTTAVGRREEERLLLEGLRRLPVNFQILLELHYWEGLSGRDIGAVMDRPSSTIRGQLVQARKLLRDAMEEIAASTELLDNTVSDLDGWATELRDQFQSDRATDTG